jgi:hypothetical protein
VKRPALPSWTFLLRLSAGFHQPSQRDVRVGSSFRNGFTVADLPVLASMPACFAAVISNCKAWQLPATPHPCLLATRSSLAFARLYQVSEALTLKGIPESAVE